MRILHSILEPRLSGAEILVRGLAHAHAARGHEAAIASLLPPNEDFLGSLKELSDHGVRLFLPTRRLGRGGRLARTYTSLLAFRPDVVFAHSVIPAGYVRLAGLSFKRTAVVPVFHAEDDFANARLRAAERLLRHTSRVSLFVSEIALRNYELRVGRKARMEVVHNGIELDTFRCSRERTLRARTRVGLDNHERVLLQVGRIHPVKQQRKTLDALLQLLNASAGLQLWFAGAREDIQYAQRLEDDIHRHGLASRVRILGSRQDVADLLCAASVFLMPSRQEAQPVAFLEALAAGLPIVASPIPPFEFARRLPGICLIPVENHADFSGAVEKYVETGERFDRDMTTFSIANVAKVYEAIGSEAGGLARERA